MELEEHHAWQFEGVMSELNTSPIMLASKSKKGTVFKDSNTAPPRENQIPVVSIQRAPEKQYECKAIPPSKQRKQLLFTPPKSGKEEDSFDAGFDFS
jgi:hypothetical protein